MRYVVIVRPAAHTLADAVEDAMKEGWMPIGGVVYAYNGGPHEERWAQAMTHTNPKQES